MPSPLKSPVPTTDQVVGMLPTTADDDDLRAVHEPDRGVAAGVAPQQVGLAVAVEVALPDDRPGGRAPRRSRPTTRLAAPFISQIAVLPLVSRQAMSLLPSPLKSWVLGLSGSGGAAKTHAAPMPMLSAGPPTMAVLRPSADSATEVPCSDAPDRAGADQLAALLGPDPVAAGEDPRRAGVGVVAEDRRRWRCCRRRTARRSSLDCGCPTAPVPTSLLPCWVHTPLLRVKTHAAPTPRLSPGPPTMAVLPSADSATEVPWSAAGPAAPVPTSLLPCWVQTPLLRVKTHAAPTSELSPGPPTMAVLPSADSATEVPWPAAPTAPVPTSLLPCWVQTPLLRVKTHAAPATRCRRARRRWRCCRRRTARRSSLARRGPTAPVPTSLLPCWVHTPSLRVKTHAAPASELSPRPADDGGVAVGGKRDGVDLVRPRARPRRCRPACCPAGSTPRCCA